MKKDSWMKEEIQQNNLHNLESLRRKITDLPAFSPFIEFHFHRGTFSLTSSEESSGTVLQCHRDGQVERGTCDQFVSGLRAGFPRHIHCPGASSIVHVLEQPQGRGIDIDIPLRSTRPVQSRSV